MNGVNVLFFHVTWGTAHLNFLIKIGYAPGLPEKKVLRDELLSACFSA